MQPREALLCPLRRWVWGGLHITSICCCALTLQPLSTAFNSRSNDLFAWCSAPLPEDLFAALDDLSISGAAPASPIPDLASLVGSAAGISQPTSSLNRQVSFTSQCHAAGGRKIPFSTEREFRFSLTALMQGVRHA